MVSAITVTALGTGIALLGSGIALIPWIPPVTSRIERWKDIPELAAGRKRQVQHKFLSSDHDEFQVIADHFTSEYDLEGDFKEIRYHPGLGTTGSPMRMLTAKDVNERENENDIVGESVGDFNLHNPQLMQEKNDRWQAVQRHFAAVSLAFLVLGAILQLSGLLLV